MSKKQKSINHDEKIEISRKSLAMLTDCIVVAYSFLAKHQDIAISKQIVEELKEQINGEKSL